MYYIYDGETLVDMLDPDDPDRTCRGHRTGGIGEMCGGCDGCLLMQVNYANSQGAQLEIETSLRET